MAYCVPNAEAFLLFQLLLVPDFNKLAFHHPNLVVSKYSPTVFRQTIHDFFFFECEHILNMAKLFLDNGHISEFELCQYFLQEQVRVNGDRFKSYKFLHLFIPKICIYWTDVFDHKVGDDFSNFVCLRALHETVNFLKGLVSFQIQRLSEEFMRQLRKQLMAQRIANVIEAWIPESLIIVGVILLPWQFLSVQCHFIASFYGLQSSNESVGARAKHSDFANEMMVNLDIHRFDCNIGGAKGQADFGPTLAIVMEDVLVVDILILDPHSSMPVELRVGELPGDIFGLEVRKMEFVGVGEVSHEGEYLFTNWLSTIISSSL